MRGRQASHNPRMAKGELLFIPWSSRPVFPFISTKFVTALLPLVLLGYMLGWMVSAVSAGVSINPIFIMLDCVGILLALWRCKEAV